MPYLYPKFQGGHSRIVGLYIGADIQRYIARDNVINRSTGRWADISKCLSFAVPPAGPLTNRGALGCRYFFYISGKYRHNGCADFSKYVVSRRYTTQLISRLFANIQPRFRLKRRVCICLQRFARPRIQTPLAIRMLEKPRPSLCSDGGP